MTDKLDFDSLGELLWSFAGHRVLTTAARAGLLGALASGSRTADELALELGLDRLATGKFVRALTALGVLEASGEHYRVSPALAAHFAPGASGITAFLEHSHQMYDRWGKSLEPWLRGQPWQTQPRSEEETARFGEAMRAMGAIVAERLASAVDLARAKRLLDLGGSLGHYAEQLVAHWPQLHAVVLDVPAVAELGQERLRGTSAGSRVQFVGGDYHETDCGSDFDAVLLANVLHQEPAAEAFGLVRRASNALLPGGQLLVVDWAIDDEKREHKLGALFAINMRSFGDTYSFPEIRHWMQEAGLEDITRTSLGKARWLIRGSKSPD